MLRRQVGLEEGKCHLRKIVLARLWDPVDFTPVNLIVTALRESILQAPPSELDPLTFEINLRITNETGDHVAANGHFGRDHSLRNQGKACGLTLRSDRARQVDRNQVPNRWIGISAGGTGAMESANGFAEPDSSCGLDGRQPKMPTTKPINNGTPRIGIEIGRERDLNKLSSQFFADSFCGCGKTLF